MKTAIVGGGLALLALLTFHHNSTVWTSERALWANAVHWAPEHPRPWINLGLAWLQEGDQALARQAWESGRRAAASPQRSAYERTAGLALTDTNLAWLDLMQQQYPEALARLDGVLATQPHFGTALALRAQVKLKLGDCEGAQVDWTAYRIYGAQEGVVGTLPRC